MLSIKVNNEDLDLRPGTTMDMEQNNPYLQFNSTDVIGEYSLPISVPNTQKNNRLLNLTGSFQKRVDNTGLDVALYDEEFQDSIGKLKYETVNVNLNRMQNGDISCYYLTGTSYFNKALDGKKLRDVNFGGDRTFAWDNYNRNGAGFWGHIHKVLDAAPGYGASGYDYAFFPVINKQCNWQGGGSDVINGVTPTAGTLDFNKFGTAGDANPIMPYVYLKYILQKAFDYIGWAVRGDILDDPDFCKITLDNSRAIDWAIYLSGRIKILGAIGNFVMPKASIAFNLVDHVPDITISDLLLQLRSYFGWSYDVDRRSKVVTIKELKTVAATGVKDFTAKASPIIPKTILTAQKIYSLKNGSGFTISLTGLNDKGTVAKITDLPAASQASYQDVYLVISENTYYVCQQNEDNGNWEWAIMEHNIGDVAPKGSTDEIPTTVLTAGGEKYNDYLDFIPRIDQSIFWVGRTEDSSSTQILLLFYTGIRQNKRFASYPYASSHIYDSNSNVVSAWSLALQGKDLAGNEIGLYQVNWLPFISKLQTTETLLVTLYLSRVELMNLKFHDELNIAGVKMYISKIKRKISYDGKIDLECSRI
jgi:hypothetical protein